MERARRREIESALLPLRDAAFAYSCNHVIENQYQRRDSAAERHSAALRSLFPFQVSLKKHGRPHDGFTPFLHGWREGIPF